MEAKARFHGVMAQPHNWVSRQEEKSLEILLLVKMAYNGKQDTEVGRQKGHRCPQRHAGGTELSDIVQGIRDTSTNSNRTGKRERG